MPLNCRPAIGAAAPQRSPRRGPVRRAAASSAASIAAASAAPQPRSPRSSPVRRAAAPSPVAAPLPRPPRCSPIRRAAATSPVAAPQPRPPRCSPVRRAAAPSAATQPRPPHSSPGRWHLASLMKYTYKFFRPPTPPIPRRVLISDRVAAGHLSAYRSGDTNCCVSPLVDSPAEGAARRSVTVYRDRPAPQPLREQEQIRAADATVAGSVHRGPAGFTVRGLDRLRLAESCQPGRCLYASVSGTSNIISVHYAVTVFSNPFFSMQSIWACRSRQPSWIARIGKSQGLKQADDIMYFAPYQRLLKRGV